MVFHSQVFMIKSEPHVLKYILHHSTKVPTSPFNHGSVPVVPEFTSRLLAHELRSIRSRTASRGQLHGPRAGEIHQIWEIHSSSNWLGKSAENPGSLNFTMKYQGFL